MPPPPSVLDPDGHYARLGVEPAASQPQIAKAFRARARILHPDVPRTGNAEAFVRLKQAYDILSDPQRRATYDRRAERPAPEDDEPVVIYPAPPPRPRPIDLPIAPRLPRLSGVPVAVWAGMATVLALGLIGLATHLHPSARPAETPIRPNAPIVPPLSPSDQRTVLYGLPPVHLAGTPNFYVTPSTEPAVLWRRPAGQSQLLRVAELPPFSTGHAIRLERQSGLVEVQVSDTGSGFIAASRIALGDSRTARRAYCGYNAGPVPEDGELLERRTTGNGSLSVDNHAPQPAVVKLRDPAGMVALSVFLGPGSHSDITGIPAGTYRPEFALGELWSRACNGFTAPVRTGRLAAVTFPGETHLTVSADPDTPGWQPIFEQDFEQE